MEAITKMEDDFAKWYTDVVLKAELADYSSVKGCMIIRPYGYALWENIQNKLDKRLKDTGHENVYMPLFIPESLFQKEKDHIEGFAPEVAVVTKGGDEDLAENLIVRPTSETLFCEHFSHIIETYHDLPKKYNQWCSVVRLEKTTRPFLRTTEFLWQEGHTIHQTPDEAKIEALLMLDLYEDLLTNYLAIPVIKGQKTEKEKFAGANMTFTIESLMHDGKALQCGTTHYFADNFAKPFNITFTNELGNKAYVYQTSFGVTTRLIGALIMVHGDNEGLVLPPKIAPTQVIIIPISQHQNGVLEETEKLRKLLSKSIRVKVDASDKRPGWKFHEHEMRGIPLRIELGPKDIASKSVVILRRDTLEKQILSLENIENKILNLLDEVQANLYNRALKSMNMKTSLAYNLSDLKNHHTGFIKAMWCGDQKCEEKIKEETGLTSRCLPFEQESFADTCVCCGKKAKHMTYFGKAY